ncbi:MAG: RNA polymerase sigma-70 factor [Agriterribacter sp.]
MYSDQELLLLINAGDVQAFTVLYRRYWEELLTAAGRVLRDKDAAEDILQEVFLSIWKRHSTFSVDGSVQAYLHNAIRYKALSYLQKNITRRDYLSAFQQVSEQLLTGADSPLHLKEIQRVIHNAVEQMPAKMKTTYMLSRHEHISHKEIARKMGVTEQTVKKQIHYALHIIKNSLGKILSSLF